MRKNLLNNLIIILTSDCNLRCEYCPVKKSKETISQQTLRRTIDLFLDSPGKYKRIKLFGGEPFLYFDLIKFVFLYGRKKAQNYGKELVFEITTNGTVFDDRILKFLEKNKGALALAISFDFKRKNFKKDLGRVEINKKILEGLRGIGMERIMASFVISPDTIDRLFDNLVYLVELGFKNFNLLPVFYTNEWGRKDLSLLEKELKAVVSFAKLKNVYLKGFNAEEQNTNNSLYNMDLTVAYNGDIFASDIFLLKHLFKKGAVLEKIGNINEIEDFGSLLSCEKDETALCALFPENIRKNTAAMRFVLNKALKLNVRKNL